MKGVVKKKSKNRSIVTLDEYARAKAGPKPRRAYLVFFSEKAQEMKGGGQGKGLELTPKIAQLWSQLSDQEKEPLKAIAAANMQEWKARVEATKEELYEKACTLSLPVGWHEVSHREANSGKSYSWYYHVDDSGKQTSQYSRPFLREELEDISEQMLQAKKKTSKAKKK